MKEFLNENTLFNTVAMYIKESDTLLLVVEGDDDHLVLKRHCSADLRLLAGVGGRQQVLRAAALASKRQLKGVRFLVDRDYNDFVESTSPHSRNVFFSSTHDIFMDLCAGDPDLLGRVIDVHAISLQRNRREDVPPPPSPLVIQEQAFTLAMCLAAVRIVSAKRNLNLDFKRFSFGGLSVSQFDTAVIARMVLERCGYGEEDFEILVVECLDVYEAVSERRQFVVGDHDLFAALARILKRFGLSVGRDNLQKSFIMGVSCVSIVSAAWFKDVQSWCARNSRAGFTCVPRVKISA